MKEKSFRFRNSFGEAVMVMDDKQAGQFIKGLCGYIFNGKPMDSNDIALRSSFLLVRAALDADQRDIENGRRGGVASAAHKYKSNGNIVVLADMSNQNCPMEEILKGMTSADDETQNHSNGEDVAKNDKN